MKRKADESSEDEGGRSSLGKRKYRKQVSNEKDGVEEPEIAEEAMDHQDTRRQRSEAVERSRNATSYLDEVLSRKNKKKHKSKDTGKGVQDTAATSD